MAQVKALSPDEMLTHWQQALPDEVVETFNNELAKKFDGKMAIVKTAELHKALKQKGVSVKEVTEQNWLKQTQNLYAEQGWKVDYKSPGWDDSFDPYFRFDLK